MVHFSQLAALELQPTCRARGCDAGESQSQRVDKPAYFPSLPQLQLTVIVPLSHQRDMNDKSWLYTESPQDWALFHSPQVEDLRRSLQIHSDTCPRCPPHPFVDVNIPPRESVPPSEAAFGVSEAHPCPTFRQIRHCDEFRAYFYYDEGYEMKGRQKVPLHVQLTLSSLPAKKKFDAVYQEFMRGQYTEYVLDDNEHRKRLLEVNYHTYEVAWRLFEAIVEDYGERLNSVSRPSHASFTGYR